MPSTYSDPRNIATLDPKVIAGDLRASTARAERQLNTISAEVAATPLGPGKWSTQQVVGHLKIGRAHV